MMTREAENVAARIGGWLLYCAIVAGLIFVGWREPLSYRFKSRAEIYAIEHPAPPPSVPKPVIPPTGAWVKDSPRTSLDGDGTDGRGNSYRPAGAPPANSGR